MGIIALIGESCIKTQLFCFQKNLANCSRAEKTTFTCSYPNSSGGAGEGWPKCAIRRLQETRKKRYEERWGCFGKSMSAWNIVVVHLKGNTSSIKQTWWTGPIHQSAVRISYWVQLWRDKCRTSSVCPRLPIDRDHHCDVAFYLTTRSLKPYIIPNTEISKEEEGWEGHGPDCIFYSQKV